MDSFECRRLKRGTMVRHRTKGYAGFFDGITDDKKLFESATDPIGCQVKVNGIAHRLIASPYNLESLEDAGVEERHKALLASAGLQWTGSRKKESTDPARKPREAHCWSCKQELNEAVDRICNSCGWMLCQCGACGCGFSDKRVVFTKDSPQAIEARLQRQRRSKYEQSL